MIYPIYFFFLLQTLSWAESNNIYDKVYVIEERSLPLQLSEYTVDEYEAADIKTHIRIVHGQGVSYQNNTSSIGNFVALDEREYIVYFDSRLEKSQVKNIVENNTNNLMNDLMLGVHLNATYIEKNEDKLTAINSRIAYFDQTGYNQKENRIVVQCHTGNNDASSNSGIVLGYNYLNNNDDYHTLVVIAFPYTNMSGETNYTLDPRVLIHEFLHSNQDQHSDNCKSIMYEDLSYHMGLTSLYNIIQANWDNVSSLFYPGFWTCFFYGDCVQREELYDGENQFPKPGTAICSKIDSCSSLLFIDEVANIEAAFGDLDLALVSYCLNQVTDFDQNSASMKMKPLDELTSDMINYRNSVITQRAFQYFNYRINTGKIKKEEIENSLSKPAFEKYNEWNLNK